MNTRQREQRQIRYSSAAEQAEKMLEKDFGPSELKLPQGFPIFKFKKGGMHRLSIIPYEVGKGNPYADEGFIHYERSYWAHQCGLERKRHMCLRKTFGKPCPVCEYVFALPDRFTKGSADYQLYRSLKEGHRQIFYIEDMNERDKGIQIFPTYYYFGLGEAIMNKVNANREKYGCFYCLQGGFILGVSVSQESFQGRPTFKVKNVEMEERREDLPESILDKVPCLDNMLIELPYDKLKQILLEGRAKPDEKQPESPAREASTRESLTREAPREDSGWMDRRAESPRTELLRTEMARHEVARTAVAQERPSSFARQQTASQATSPIKPGDHVIYKGEDRLVVKIPEEGKLDLEDEDGIITKGVPLKFVKLNDRFGSTNEENEPPY